MEWQRKPDKFYYPRKKNRTIVTLTGFLWDGDLLLGYA